MITSRRTWGAALMAVGVAAACSKSNNATPDAGRVTRTPPRPAWSRPDAAPGEMPLDTSKSKLSLVIIKDRDTKSPVTATMLPRDGAVSLASASARLSIDIDTFDSAIPLRNERVRGIFFETATLGQETAELTIPKIPAEVLSALHDKKRAHGQLDATLKMHGRSSALTLPFDAGYTDAGALWVKSAEPIEIKISDFGLSDNLRRLSSICMHDSIDDIVKVDVSLVFAQE